MLERRTGEKQEIDSPLIPKIYNAKGELTVTINHPRCV